MGEEHNYCHLDVRSFEIRITNNYEPLAQSVEHLTFNQRVAGSNPAWLINIKNKAVMRSSLVFINAFKTTGYACVKINLLGM